MRKKIDSSAAAVSERLRWLLKSRAVSIRALHLDLKARGVPGGSLPALQRYVAGAVEPPISVLSEIADLLEIRLAWLVTGEGYRTKKEQELFAFRDAQLGSRSRKLADEAIGGAWAGWGRLSFAAKQKILTAHMLHVGRRALLRETVDSRVTSPSPAEQQDLAVRIAELLKQALDSVDVSLEELSTVQINAFAMDIAGALTSVVDATSIRKHKAKFNEAVDQVASGKSEDE